MDKNCKSSEEGNNPKVIIDRQNPHGGNRGRLFDSGCNLSGVRKVHIHTGPFQGREYHYHDSAIKRIFLEFETALQPGRTRTPSYPLWGWRAEGDETRYPPSLYPTTERTFVVDPEDPIVRIDVWSNYQIVTAIRFHLESGSISEIYGMVGTQNGLNPPVVFEGRRPGSRLVGVHGFYSGVIDTLGFTFASEWDGSEPIDNNEREKFEHFMMPIHSMLHPSPLAKWSSFKPPTVERRNEEDDSSWTEAIQPIDSPPALVEANEMESLAMAYEEEEGYLSVSKMYDAAILGAILGAKKKKNSTSIEDEATRLDEIGNDDYSESDTSSDSEEDVLSTDSEEDDASTDSEEDDASIDIEDHESDESKCVPSPVTGCGGRRVKAGVSKQYEEAKPLGVMFEKVKVQGRESKQYEESNAWDVMFKKMKDRRAKEKSNELESKKWDAMFKALEDYRADIGAETGAETALNQWKKWSAKKIDENPKASEAMKQEDKAV
jgi:hypothetical protein